MSNRDPEKSYENMTDTLRFVFEQMTKNLYVSIPGIIDNYNPSTKRAIVHPAINIQKTDGEIIQHESIVNVPVIWPSGGGFTVIAPLLVGDTVLICFSQRGITKFKETFSESDPGIGLFDKEDAYVIAGFGALSITPATTIGISMQSEDKTDYIFIEKNKIEIKTPALINVECANMTTTVAAAIVTDATSTETNVAATVVTNVVTSTSLTCPTNTITGNLYIVGNISWTGTSTGGAGYAGWW